MHFFFRFLMFVLSNPLFNCPSQVQAFESYVQSACDDLPILGIEPSTSPVQGPIPSTSPFVVPEPSVLPVQGPDLRIFPIIAPAPSTLPVQGDEPSTSPVQGHESSTSPVQGPEPSTSPVQGPEPSTSPSLPPAPSPGQERPDVCRSNALTGNPIDDCWRFYGQVWAKHRRQLAKCGVGFGRNAIGGFNGPFYVVTRPDDDPNNPQKGTLRYGAMQDEPLWIIFARDMLIKVKQHIRINSFKTIDGRGVEVVITSSNSTCLEMTDVTNVIIHGVQIHDCHEDGMTLTNSSHVWVDHCSLSSCGDGLIDVVRGSTSITLSNNYLTHHNKVILLGNSDKDVEDKNMRVTVAYNHFGEGCIQRLPRCRFGHFHVVNNHYTNWVTYAIGGSAAPTILSQGNIFLDTDERSSKTVTKHIDAEGDKWEAWNWRSEGDLLLNGTHFIESGSKSLTAYLAVTSLRALPATLVPLLTKDAGVILCKVGECC